MLEQLKIPQQTENLRIRNDDTQEAIEHYEKCPTCHKKINEKATPEILKEYHKKLTGKNMVRCSNGECGVIMNEEEEKCPGCGGTNAEPIQ